MFILLIFMTSPTLTVAASLLVTFLFVRFSLVTEPFFIISLRSSPYSLVMVGNYGSA